jgi:hypothetical protein
VSIQETAAGTSKKETEASQLTAKVQPEIKRRGSISDVNTLPLVHSVIPLCFGAVTKEQ